MAKVIYAGGELDSVLVVGGSVSESTTSGSFDSADARCSLLCSSSSAIIRGFFIDENNEFVSVTTGETLYFHVDLYLGTSPSSGSNIWQATDSSNRPWIALRASGTSGVLSFVYNSGSGASPVWTEIGTWAYGEATRQAVDIALTLGTPHLASLTVGGALLLSGTFTQPALTALSRWEGRGVSGAAPARFSKIFATEGLSTVGGRCLARSARGAGSSSGWTGAYTDINEMPLNDSTVLTAAAAGLTSTFAYNAITTPAGFVVKSIFLAARARNDGTAPANLKAVCRRNGTDHATGNLAGIGTGFAPIMAQWSRDPDTGGVWTDSAFNVAELGVLSAT